MLLISVLLASGASAQPPPAGATPGGALPVLPSPPPEPPTLEDIAPFPIPPAVERPLDVDAGERLFVTKFVLKGVTDHPEEGITRAEIEQMIEEFRSRRLGLTEVDENGFTEAEQQRISEFMRSIVDDRDRDLRIEEFQELVDNLREQRIRREAGMTIGQIHEIAAKITERYREAGFILAQAFIPAQEVSDGVVAIEVFEGRLGAVLMEGNEIYSDAVLAKPFQDLIDTPVTASGIETALLITSDYPGLSVFGVFQPGTEVGETDLVLRVQDERRFDFSVRSDNYGTRFTGEYRFWVDGAVNNLTGAGDRLYGAYLRQIDPTNGRFWQVQYERPVWVPGLTVGASAQRNPFDVGSDLGELGLAGESEIFRVFANKALVRSRQRNVFGSLTWRRETATTDLQDIEIARDELSMLEAEINFDSIDSRARGINLGAAGLTLGLGDLLGGHDSDTVRTQSPPPSRVGSNGEFASNDFWKVYGSFSRLQKITEHVSILVRTEGQWSTQLLTSLEQFNIGGPASVRAYPVSEALFDTGAFGSAELTINAPGFARKQAFKGLTWGEILRVSFFSDFAWGELNDALISERSDAEFAGYGAGVSIGVPGYLQGRLQWASPFGSKRGSDGDKSRWWFELTYQY